MKTSQTTAFNLEEALVAGRPSFPPHWKAMQLKRLVGLQSGESITSETIEVEGRLPVFGENDHWGYTDHHTHEGDHVLIGRQGALCGNINYAHGQF